eukprot:242235_1
MLSLTISLVFIISLIINSNSQCTTGESATKSNGPITVTATLCKDDDNLYIDITYNQYNGNWFAICFPSNPTQNGMIGTAMAYSTGKTSDSLPAGVYAYTITAANVNGVSQPDNTIWTEESTIINTPNNNIQVIYKTPLINVPFDFTTTSIPFSYATGNANQLYLSYHASRVSSKVVSDLVLQFPTNPPTKTPSQTPTVTTIIPSQSPTKTPTVTTIIPSQSPTNNDPTISPTNNPSITPSTPPSKTPTSIPIQSEYQICAEAEVVTDVILSIGRKISDQTMSITITGPADKWIAFGFGKDVMQGSYAVTVAKLDAGDSNAEVRQYTLAASSTAASASNLGTLLSVSGITVEKNDVNGVIRTITITRPYMVDTAFDFTAFLTCNINELDIISARGDSINLAYHGQREKGTLTRLNSCVCDGPAVSPTSAPVDNTKGNGGDGNKIFNPLYIIVALCIGLYFVV